MEVQKKLFSLKLRGNLKQPQTIKYAMCNTGCLVAKSSTQHPIGVSVDLLAYIAG